MGMYGKCPTCGKLTAFEGVYCKKHAVEYKREHVSYRNAVVIAASVGVCMFCSRPDATMRFTNDDSVRICTACVE